MKWILAASIFLAGAAVHAETVKIQDYSGKIGYAVKLGTEFQLTVDAVLMNSDVVHFLNKQKFEKLGEEKTCEVDGVQQAIGYTIFKIKSCKP